MSSYIKIIGAVRRKPNMTRKEYLDYHFQVHGQMSDIGELDAKPAKYRQYHVFDAAFGERVSEGPAPPNRNHPWVGRDDVTELYFRDAKHIESVFTSEHVQRTVGADGLNFNDFETGIIFIAQEKDVPLATEAAKEHPLQDDLSENGHCVACYFASTTTAATVDALVVAFREALEAHASKEARALVVDAAANLGDSKITAYFGGANDMPHYSIMFKVVLASAASVGAIRVAQRAFEERARDALKLSDSFILFAKEGLVLDADHGIPFDASRQPKMGDLDM